MARHAIYFKLGSKPGGLSVDILQQSHVFLHIRYWLPRMLNLREELLRFNLCGSWLTFLLEYSPFGGECKHINIYCDGKLTKIPKRDFIFARVKTGQVGT